jgi:regulator of sirC expression with transglutaminase-like and TPR domain
MRTLATELFKEMVSRPDPHMDLASAALLIALDEYPALDIPKYVREIESMAAALRSDVAFSGNTQVIERLQRLNRFLFGVKGFRGNRANYYDPRNSFLNEVLDRRLGIPITLSVILIEVAARLGLKVEGVGMPGHFVVKCEVNGWEVFVDPFNKGEILGEQDCRKRVEEQFGPEFQFHRSFLHSVTKHQILARMLTNLKGIYLQQQEFSRALSTVEKILLVNPNSSSEIRDRGSIHFKLNNMASALEDWVRYLEVQPDAADAAEVKNRMKAAAELMALRN